MIHTSIALSLILSQVQAAPAQVVQATNTLVAAYQDRVNRTVSRNATNTRVCIGSEGGQSMAGRTVVRLGVVIFSKQAQIALGLDSPTGEAYGAMEIQIDSTQPSNRFLVEPDVLLQLVDVIREEVEIRVSPVLAACEVAIVRFDAPEIASAGLFRCACRVSDPCAWDPDGAGPIVSQTGAAINGFTMGPSTWSGAGCKPKPCFTRYDHGADNSWPVECPK